MNFVELSSIQQAEKMRTKAQQHTQQQLNTRSYIEENEELPKKLGVGALEINKEQFKKMFSNLVKEMNSSEQKLAIKSIRSNTETAEKVAKAQKNLSNYDPDIIDFLRRCDNKQQAEEIIAYMENRGEVTRNYAQKLRQQLKKKGLRSFGSKKEEGYYFNVTNK